MILKEAVAYLINDGVYSCGNDIEAEKRLYEGFVDIVQKGVDRAREVNPEWTEERLRAYANDGSTGQLILYMKDCLDSLGYDTSTLPHVIVPEFPIPGMAGAITAGAMGAAVAYMKLKNWRHDRKESCDGKGSTQQ